ncbi:MAG TPA: hypothetical protein VH916_04550, partial [Dehalococcoidia bacterium]
MANEPAIGDPVQAGCAAGRRARAVDAAAGGEPAGRAVLLMRAAMACAVLIDALPGPPQHDPLVARERFVWAFVLGYEEGAETAGTRAAHHSRGQPGERSAVADRAVSSTRPSRA